MPDNTHGPIVWIALLTASLAAPATAAQAGPPADIAVVLDISGSIGAGAHRFDDIARWVGAFATETDRIAVVAMGYRPRIVAPLTPAPDLAWDAIREDLAVAEKYTDVANGLERAFFALKDTPDTRDKVVVLYSDGRIDLPQGLWAVKNSLRYLRESLVPAMKQRHMRILAIVPPRKIADFALLQELTATTGGDYYAQLPPDPVALRMASPAAAMAQTAPAPSPAPSAAPVAAPAASPQTRPAKVPSPPVVHRAAPKQTFTNAAPPQPASTRSSTSSLWYVLAAGAVLLAIGGVLFAVRRRRRRHALTEMLEEMQILRQSATRATPAPVQTQPEPAQPDVQEPQEEALTVSEVTPFLDYEPDRSATKAHPSDEISGPALYAGPEGDFSVSTMETLIGTPGEIKH